MHACMYAIRPCFLPSGHCMPERCLHIGLGSACPSLCPLPAAACCLIASRQVPNPDSSSGLYIRDRHGDIIKATFPADCIAFQVRGLYRRSSWARCV